MVTPATSNGPGLRGRRGVFEQVTTLDCDVVSEGECADFGDLDGERGCRRSVAEVTPIQRPQEVAGAADTGPASPPPS